MLERTAVETFLRRLNIERGDVNNIITIHFRSEDPNKAAKIANAIADTYIATGGERKLNSNKVVSRLLEDRLIDIKQQSVNADRALQEFKLANNLSALTAPDNGLITRLRSDYVDLARKANEIADAVGPDHLAVIKIRKQMDGLNAAMRAEEERLAGSPAGDLDVGPADPAAQDGDLSVGLAKLDGNQQAKYRELEITARTLRALYNSDLRKFNELSQSRPDTEDAHIITSAAPPLQKDANKSLLVLAGGSIFGSSLRHRRSYRTRMGGGVYRTPNQVTLAPAHIA